MRILRLITALSLLVSVLLFPLQALATNDVERALRDIPPHQRAVYRQQLAQLERVARRLLQAVPNSPQVQFLLAAGEPSINAGATFGKVIISEGMMQFVRSDDELAMILGHELAHLTQGHVARGAMQNTLLGLGSLIIGTVYPGVGQAAGQIGQLFLNRFNQSQEREADEAGLRYAFDAGYDPWAGVQVMQRMAEDVPETATAGFFSSHPSSVERAAALERSAAQLSAPDGPRLAADDATYPRPPLERDEAACQRAKPYFYRASDTSDLTEKVALYQQGLRICPQSPRAHFELADAYAQRGDTRKAVAELREVLRYDPAYPGARLRLRVLERRLSHWGG